MKTLRKTRRAPARSARKRRIRSGHVTLRTVGLSRRRESRNRSRVGGRKRENHLLDARYISAVRKFDEAARAFRSQKYGKARELFEKLASGEVREVAERARVHLQLCHQKLSAPAPRPKNAEEYYTLGVGALNARNLRAAIEHLGKADKLAPNQEHIRYALATAHALEGNTGAALEQLKSAITLRPANRIQARHDEDLAGLAADPRFRHLVYMQGS